MNIFENLLSDVEIPRFVKVYQDLDSSMIEDIDAAVGKALERKGTLDIIKPGDTVCLTCGSREVANVAKVLRSLCDRIKAVGGKPFIIPAMGSHAGADADGQKAICAGYGVTEETMGVPVKSCMDTDVIGYTDDGQEVHMDHFANEADIIIPVGRIKAHTDFHGPVESGICKMLVIGIGKQHGAYSCHRQGFGHMAENVLKFSSVILEKKKNIFAVGLMENAFHNTYRIEAIPEDRIMEEEPVLLLDSKAHLAKVPFNKADVLICNEGGKNISGSGMDPNVTGRSPCTGVIAPFFERIAVLDLTDISHGNFAGLGNAEITTQRLYRKINFEQTYPNSITAAEPISCRLPIVMPNDRTAIKMAIRTAVEIDWKKGPRVVWLKNTLSLKEFYVSEALLEDVKMLDHVTAAGECFDVPFDDEGNAIGMY